MADGWDGFFSTYLVFSCQVSVFSYLSIAEAMLSAQFTASLNEACLSCCGAANAARGSTVTTGRSLFQYRKDDTYKLITFNYGTVSRGCLIWSQIVTHSFDERTACAAQ